MPSAPINPITKRPTPERILLYGGPGAGKTRAFFETALWHAKTGDDAHFHYVDLDGSFERMFVGGRYDQLEANTTAYHIYTWDEFDELSQRLEKDKVLRPGDWLGVDMASQLWEMVQDWWVEGVYGELDTADYMTTRRMAGEADPRFDGWTDWGYINKAYRARFVRLIQRTSAHVMSMAAETNIKDADKADIRDMFKTFGVKPAGQKALPHEHHTVLWMGKKRDRWVMSTAKDREVEWMVGEETGCFWLRYLMGIVGWE